MLSNCGRREPPCCLAGAFLDSTGVDRAQEAGSGAAAVFKNAGPNLNGKQQQPQLALAA